MQSYGIAHVWAEGDFVTHAIGIVLAAMSIISWTVIVLKLTQLWRVQRITLRTEAQFWNASDYSSGLQALNSVARNPYAALPPPTMLQARRNCAIASISANGSHARSRIRSTTRSRACRVALP
jgi:biopolymer transport protein ExbB/TolQ